MTTAIRLALVCLALVLILAGAAWYYLFGPNRIAASDLVPADTLVFATLPNAAEITTDYQMSHLKQVLDSPNAKPLTDSVAHLIGQKNLDLLQSFAPLLSGQSYVAMTHFDPANPAQVGLIAGLKPKPGLGNFNGFIDKLKAAYPHFIAQGTTGTGQVEGLDYQWIKGPNASDKICVAQYRGWIITAWGEATLQDWWDRLQKKSTTPSLSQNPDYQKSLARVGKNPEAILYADFHALLGLAQKRFGSNPKAAYLAQKWQAIGAAMIGTRFEDGDITDHFSMLIPRQAQVDLGAGSPCAFDTLKFTSPDTRFYWARNFNAARIWKNLQEQASQTPPANPAIAAWVAGLQGWAQSENIDLQHNMIDALGDEVSLQMEWSADTTYPEAGLFVKLAKPDDFKPVAAALVDTFRKRYAATAVVNEINSNGQNFATLKFIQPLPISPTITEDGPYFGVFLTENQAVRSFQRDASVGLLNDAHFKSQIGDKRSGASQIVFLDSPRFLDRAYQTALPYLSLAAMFNRTLGSLLQNRTMPSDLQWLAPVGSWSFVMSLDDDGMKAYSVSGIGNQGIYLAGGLSTVFPMLRSLGNPLGALAPPTLPPAAAPSIPPNAAAPAPDTATNIAPETTAPPSDSSNAAPSASTPVH